jgi:hypothetical protein
MSNVEQQPAPLAEINWRKCMVKHRLHRKPWRAAWGPPPGERGCLVPQAMLDEVRA